MRLVTFHAFDGQPRAGVLVGTTVIDLAAAAPLVLEDIEDTRWDMLSLLRNDQEGINLDTVAQIVAVVLDLASGETGMSNGREAVSGYDASETGMLALGGVEMLLPLDQLRLLAPLPRPSSLRTFCAFEQHATALWELRRKTLPPMWYDVPIFTFGNHGAIVGPDADLPMPRTRALDYALAIGCVIGREGANIAADEAGAYIAGYTIVNNWVARDIETEEYLMGMGATKSHDFATSLGPWLVTPDELEIYADDDGRHHLTMLARVNGVVRSQGSAASIFYPFAEMIAYASRDATLYPGDVLSSGAVAAGSLFEVTQGSGPWLAEGDSIELEITGLGTLRNQIVS